MAKINETNYPRRTQASYEDTDMLVIQEAGGNTYTTRIEDLREDCQETLAPALNTMRENLATVEGSTASKAYAKGDFLVFGGRLCKAKTSIASGATLVLDTNIELDSVGDELSSINSDLTSNVGTITNSQGSSRWFSANLIKKNNVCYFDISVELASPAANSAVQIAEFPANFRPSTKKYYPCVIADGSDANSVSALIDITTAGICKVHTPAASLTGLVYAYVSGTFVIS